MAITNQKNGSILLRSGIDVSTPAEYIDDQSLRNSVNFNIDRDLVTKRAGGTTLGSAISTSDDILAGRQFTRSDVKYNVRVGLDKIEEYDAVTSSWVDITGTDLNGTTDDLIDTAVPLLSGDPILCITNGIDAIRKWTATGNTTDLGGSPPIAKFIQEYKTYLFAANIGGVDIGERVQWSDTANPELWTGGNSGIVDLVEDNESITGLNIFGDYLAVHKPSSIYLGSLVNTTNIIRFVRKSTGSGTVANGSIVNLPSGVQVFLGSDGLRAFNGISAPLIDSKINDEIRDSLNSTYAFRSYGVLVKDRDEVWFGLPIGSQTTGETIYKYNYTTGVIYKDSRINATTMWLGSASTSLSWDDYDGKGVTWDTMTERWNERTLNAGATQINIGKTDGNVSKVDVTQTSDSGEAINAFLETKEFQSGQNSICRWKQMELWARGGSVKVEYSIDGGDTWIEMSASPYTLPSAFPTYESAILIYFDVVATKIRFRFSNTEIDESLTIKQFTIDYTTRENRGA